MPGQLNGAVDVLGGQNVGAVPLTSRCGKHAEELPPRPLCNRVAASSRGRGAGNKQGH